MSSPREESGLRLLADTSDAIVAGVERELPGWVLRSVARVLDAWGRLDVASRAAADADAVVAAEAARVRVGAELRALFALDPAEQRATPLQIVRGACREPTELLRRYGIPEVVRDEFEERSWPDDVYGLVPHTLGDLGDPELGPLHLAWGMAKTSVLRARADA